MELPSYSIEHPPKNPKPVKQNRVFPTSVPSAQPAISPACLSSNQPGLPAWPSLPITISQVALVPSASLWGGHAPISPSTDKKLCPAGPFAPETKVQKLKVWFTARQLQTFNRIISQTAFAQKAVTQSWISPSAFPKCSYTPSMTQILQILSMYLTKSANKSVEPSWACSWPFCWKEPFWAHRMLIMHTRRKGELFRYCS